MFIVVHFGGQFKTVKQKKKYVGGKIHVIKEFDTDKMSWFQLRRMLKEGGICNEYIVHQKLPGKEMDNRLVVIDCDDTVIEMLNFLDVYVNVVLYIEHLESREGFDELQPDECEDDVVVNESHSDGDSNIDNKEARDNVVNDDSADDGAIVYDQKGKTFLLGDDEEDKDSKCKLKEEDKTGQYCTKADENNCEDAQQHSKNTSKKKRGRPSKRKKNLAGDDFGPEHSKETYYSNSQSLHTPILSDDDEVNSGSRLSNGVRDLTKPMLKLGMEFESPQQFRELVRQYAILNGYDLNWTKNEGPRIIVKCKEYTCPFRVYGRWSTDKSRYVLKSLTPNHNCTKVVKNKQVTAPWLAKRYLNHFKEVPDMKIEVFKNTIYRDLTVNVSNMICYRAKRFALDELVTKQFELSSKLGEYANILLQKNPGSQVVLKTKQLTGYESTVGFEESTVGFEESTVGFEAIFISFRAMIKGLIKGCRSIIGLDGCRLKSDAGGFLLSAVSRDPNNEMFPVAYAVVDVENKESWLWFLTSLVGAIGIDNVHGWTFIFDKEKELVESLKALIPSADVRFCVKHLYANFREKFRGLKLKKLIWKAATAYQKHAFEKTMAELMKESVEAYQYFDAIDKEFWTRSHFSSNPKCALLCNNMCDAWNKYIAEAMNKPVITTLEMIRTMLTRRFQIKKELIVKQVAKRGNKENSVCPKIRAILKRQVKASKDCTAVFDGEGNFVVSEHGKCFSLNLRRRYCDCMEWSLTGIPCRHGVACIIQLKIKVKHYVHESYHLSKYASAYEETIYPVTGSAMWAKLDALSNLPLNYRKQPERPATAITREVDEPMDSHSASKGRVMTCSNCKRAGHNSRGCRYDHVPNPVKTKSKVGRPPKKRLNTCTDIVHVGENALIRGGGSSVDAAYIGSSAVPIEMGRRQGISISRDAVITQVKKEEV